MWLEQGGIFQGFLAWQVSQPPGKANTQRRLQKQQQQQVECFSQCEAGKFP